MNAVLQTLSAHRSVRSYRPVPLPDEVVEQAVAAAQRAATSSWIQAYALIQINDRRERERLAELTGGQPHVAQAGAFFVVCGEVRRHKLVCERDGKPYHANLETFLLATIDASLFAQNLVLAFESLGYGSCYIGGLRNRLSEVDELLRLPADVWPLFGLCVGEPAPDAPATQRPRLPLRAVLLQDRYPDDETMLAAIAEHDREAAAWFADQGRPGRTWSGGLARKFEKPLRPRLRHDYESKGARLD